MENDIPTKETKADQQGQNITRINLKTDLNGTNNNAVNIHFSKILGKDVNYNCIITKLDGPNKKIFKIKMIENQQSNNNKETQNHLEKINKQYTIKGLKDGSLVQKGDITKEVIKNEFDKIIGEKSFIQFEGETILGEKVIIKFEVNGGKYTDPKLVGRSDLYYNLAINISKKPKIISILPDNSLIVEKVRKQQNIIDQINTLLLPSGWTKPLLEEGNQTPEKLPVIFDGNEPFDFHLQVIKDNQKYQIHFDKEGNLKPDQKIMVNMKRYKVDLSEGKIDFTTIT